MKYLILSDRKIIEHMLKSQESYRCIGRVLRRGKSTIAEEVTKNKMEYEAEYNAEKAHERSLRRQQRKGKQRKIERNESLKEHIISRMKIDQWSPQQIAGELRTICQKTIVSHETIYQFLYSDEGRKLKLWLHMRRKKKPVRQPWGTRRQRILIPHRVSIHERSEAANQKKEIGHLETDSMIFSKQSFILSVQVDRFSRKCMITKLPNKTADQTKSAIEATINELGEQHIKTITFDNGTENVKHVELKDIYQVETYFCDAYCSWQKGLVENTNGLIRQYFPRHTDLSKVTDEDIYEIQEKLNNRPRKSLHYLTPNHVFLTLAQGGRIKA